MYLKGDGSNLMLKGVLDSAVVSQRFDRSSVLSMLQDAGLDKGDMYTMFSLIRSTCLIESSASGCTKMSTRWSLQDGRRNEFKQCLEALRKAVDCVPTIVEDFKQYKVVPWEIPYGQRSRTSSVVDFEWIHDDSVCRCLELRKLILDDDRTRPILKKIVTKTYLTDRALTGKYLTNREKRWETVCASPQFATRRDCFLIEHKLLEQLLWFQGAPHDIRNKALHMGLIEEMSTTICPVLCQELSFEHLCEEVESPTHGKSAYQVGHLVPIASGGQHVCSNVSWITAHGNRIQGHLTVDETKQLIRKAAHNMDKQTQATMFSSKSPNWRTPDSFWNKLNADYNFTLDAAASKENAKCANFFNEEDNALAQDWSGHTVFCNPPYGRNLKHWVKKFFEEGRKPHTKVIALVPARTDTKFFHEYCMKAKRIYFVKGRLKFLDDNGDELAPAPFPSMVVEFDGEFDCPEIFPMDR